MMKMIWKYSIAVEGLQTLFVPEEAKLLHVGEQQGIITLWFELDPVRITESRRFCVYGTGWNMPDDHGEYAGTVFIGAFVWHVYEVKG